MTQRQRPARGDSELRWCLSDEQQSVVSSEPSSSLCLPSLVQCALLRPAASFLLCRICLRQSAAVAVAPVTFPLDTARSHTRRRMNRCGTGE